MIPRRDYMSDILIYVLLGITIFICCGVIPAVLNKGVGT